MPDRIIAATAFSLGISLVTRDLRIRALTTIKTYLVKIVFLMIREVEVTNEILKRVTR